VLPQRLQLQERPQAVRLAVPVPGKLRLRQPLPRQRHARR
jgi:hypothetical protein